MNFDDGSLSGAAKHSAGNHHRQRFP